MCSLGKHANSILTELFPYVLLLFSCTLGVKMYSLAVRRDSRKRSRLLANMRPEMCHNCLYQQLEQ